MQQFPPILINIGGEGIQLVYVTTDQFVSRKCKMPQCNTRKRSSPLYCYKYVPGHLSDTRGTRACTCMLIKSDAYLHVRAVFSPSLVSDALPLPLTLSTQVPIIGQHSPTTHNSTLELAASCPSKHYLRKTI